MAKKLGLGNGLSSLFSISSMDELLDEKNISVMRLELIEPKKSQPRKNFNKEALQELADSISKYGIIQPIIVRKSENDKYQIIAGERRWRAARLAGLTEAPVVIKNVDDITAAEMTMVENLQREDLNPIEEALGYKYLAEQYSLTQEEIARRVAKSRSVISNAIRLLSLPEEILQYLVDGTISSGHARALLALTDEESQIKMAERIINNELTVRDVEKIIREIKNASLAKSNKSRADEKEEKGKNEEQLNEAYFEKLKLKLSEVLGKKIVISKAKRQGAKNGKLEIEYSDSKDLESIVKRLCGDIAL